MFMSIFEALRVGPVYESLDDYPKPIYYVEYCPGFINPHYYYAHCREDALEICNGIRSKMGIFSSVRVGCVKDSEDFLSYPDGYDIDEMCKSCGNI